MTEPIVPIGLAKDWISRLVGRLSLIGKTRQQDLTKLRNQFGDPYRLARSYVESDCQIDNPADDDEDDPIRVFRQPIRQWVNNFLASEFSLRDGRNILFILSDAGMGKSSFLVMLKLSELSNFWPSSLSFHLAKLGNDTLAEVERLPKKERTVLLLDALDEDPNAWGRIHERLEELLAVVEPFRQVVFTCRTQFFPKVGRAPIEQAGRVVINGHICNLIYLSPFNDEQIEAYLKKRLSPSILKRLVGRLVGRESKSIRRARAVLINMRSLRMRPMLLAYIEDLATAEVEDWRLFPVYKALVDVWLLREVRKLGAVFAKGQILEACQVLALHLKVTGRREIDEKELEQLVEDYPLADCISRLDLGGRALLNLNSHGSYRFAHFSIQEFLVSQCIIGGSNTPRPRKPVPATDGLLEFLVSAADDESLRLAGAEWHLLDLKGAKLHGLNLSAIDLSNRIFRKTSFEGSCLKGANFARSKFSDADLSRADLENVNLTGANFYRTSLRNANLSGAELKSTRFKDCDLRGALLGDCSLEQFHLRHMVIDDIKSLSTLRQLKQVSLRGMLGVKLHELQGNSLLEVLNLNHTDVADLDGVQHFPNLTQLALRGTPIRSLNGVQVLKRLFLLDISQTGISDLRPVRKLENIRVLVISESVVHDLSPLKHLRNLEVLIAADTAIEDLSPLKSCRQLRVLNVSGAYAELDSECLDVLPNLVSIYPLRDGTRSQVVK